MQFVIALLASLLASLIAVSIVEAYLWARRSLHLRALKQILDFHGSKCLLVAPSVTAEETDATIHYRDTYAFSHAVALCHRLKVEVDMAPFHNLSEFADVTDNISIGGPAANRFTDRCLEDHVPGYVPHPDRGKAKSTLVETGDALSHPKGFTVGDVFLPANDNQEWALLIKITHDLLDQNRTIHLLFGYGGQGTAAAAYYLSKHYGRLASKFGARKYCVAVPVPRGTTYRNVGATFRDLTQQAFTKPDVV